jgi:endogenous inhibitor of DNA gyrase (YacG/DUF329 family)
VDKFQKEKINFLRHKGESYSKIAKSLGLSINTVQSYCRRNNLGKDAAFPSQAAGQHPQTCRLCGNEIAQTPKRKKRLFCSADCCKSWWNAHPEAVRQKAVYSFTCPVCGKPFTAYGNKGRKFCSHACYIQSRFGEKAGDRQ